MGNSAEVDSEAVSEPKTKGDYTDDELLNIVKAEMTRSIGFENDQELRDDRERALLYLKGDMKKDIDHVPGRSKAVSRDLADAVETILPDLMEIFSGGDDPVAFIPNGPNDEAQAKQETEYLKHVVWQENPGFLNFYEGIKDALLLKTVVFKYWWEAEKDVSEEEFTGKNAVEVQLAAKDGEILDLEAEPMPDNTAPQPAPDPQADPNMPVDPPAPPPLPTFSFTLRKTKDLSKAKYQAFPPDDFGVAPDTVRIAETSYCVLRSRPRVQELVADGYDEDLVRGLSSYVDDNATVQQARDQAGEHLDSNAADDSTNDLRQVETREHYVRLLGADDKLQIWCVVTDAECTKLLARGGKTRWKETRIPIAVGAPYLVAHRMYGESLSDKLFEIQRIKTVLTRVMLDSAYFALNQRYEVATAQGQSGPFTISDLMDNTPGMPVRSVSGNAVKPLNAAAVPFDGYSALEYFSTVGEQRTGVVRNAQGLNPDTLHDTAAGQQALMSAAQKRVRMIARILAETCIKELYLGMHALIRENATSEQIAQLSGQWVPVNPSQWAERNNMTVEVGIGASGQAHDMMVATQLQAMMTQLVTAQGGPHGPIVSLNNIYNLADYTAKKLGVKSTAPFFTNPAPANGQPAPPPPPPPPNPELVKVQGELAQSQQKQQSDAALETQRINAKVTTDQHLNSLEAQRQQVQMQNEMRLEEMKIQSAERIAIEVARINAQAKIAAAQLQAKPVQSDGSAILEHEVANETTA